MSFVKIRFIGRAGATAGLVLPREEVQSLSVANMSRYFPYSEAGKMERAQCSPIYSTWEEAFHHTFEDPQ